MKEFDVELSTQQAATRLGVRLDYLTMLLRSGKIDGRKQDGQWRIPEEAVKERLRQRSGRR